MGSRNAQSHSKTGGQTTEHSKPELTTKAILRQTLPFLPILGIIAYFAIFFAWPLANISQILNRPFRRYELFQLLLTPDDVSRTWLGDGGEFSILDRLPIFCGALLILIGGMAWGTTVARLLRLTLSTAETLGIGLPLGLNLLSTLVLISGLLGLLNQRWLFLGVIILPLLVGSLRWLRVMSFRFEKQDSAHRLGTLFDAMRSKIAIIVPKDGLSAVFVAAGTISVIVIILGAALPPVDFDVREYHLQCPKEFYQNGSITFLPHNVYGNMPLGTEMHALLGMILLGDFFAGAITGKVVIATFALMGAVLIGRLVQDEKDPRLWIGPALFISVPWVIAVSTAGLNDVALTVYVFAAFFAIHQVLLTISNSTRGPMYPFGGTQRGLKSDRTQTAGNWAGQIMPKTWAWTAIGGYLAGAAAATKYTGLAFGVLPVGLFLIVILYRKVPMRGLLKFLAVYLIAAFLGGGAWYVKNLILIGNPVYPLAYEWFGGATWNAEKAARWYRIHSPHGFSARVLAADIGRILLTSEWLSPLIVPLAILALFKVPRRNKVSEGCIAFSIGLFVIWWFLTHRIDRFWLPILPFLCVLAALGIDRIDRVSWRWFIAIASGVAITWNVLAVVSGVAADNRYFAPLAQLRNDPARIGPDHVLLNQLFGELQAKGEEKKLLCVGDAAVFELQMPVLYATCFDDQPWEILTKGKTPQQIKDTLRRENIGYVYVNWREIARYRSPGNYGFTPFVQPEQFRELVKTGILVPVLMPAGSSGQIYLVP